MTTFPNFSMPIPAHIMMPLDIPPFHLLFGCSPRLPIDLVFDLTPDNTPQSYPAYVKEWKTSMTETYRIALKHSQSSAAWAKHHFDKKARSIVLSPGDRILVRKEVLAKYVRTGETPYTRW